VIKEKGALPPLIETRPLGIALVVGYSVLVAIEYGKGGIASLWMGTETFLGVFLTLLSVLFVVAIYWLLKRASWAYKLTKGLYLILVLLGILRLLSNIQQGFDVLLAIDTALALWVCLYLRTAKVQVWFEQ